jgi:hypothetical protein
MATSRIGWTAPAPSLFGDAVLVAFLLAQASDGALTYLGIASFGLRIEANPLIAWYVGTLGPALALIGAKMFATVCVTALHLHGRHVTVGVLTVVYLAMAVYPWVTVFAQVRF